MALLPVPEALETILNRSHPIETEIISIHDTLGRVLADDVRSQLTQPPFAASAMDGYALCGNQKNYRVVAEIKAGDSAKELELNLGEAVRIFTGAMVPKNIWAIAKQEIVEATKKLVSDQDIKDGYIRPFAWRGSEMMGVSAQNTKINVAIAIWDWPTYFDPTLKLKGIKLNISKWQRPPQNSSPWQSKAAGLYMICTLSKHQAEKDGFTDSLMLDHEGNVAEATSANIFFKDKNNELHTPIPDSFLDGITRKTVIDLAKSKNIKINERKISPKELSNFKGCFITGTAAEITPVGNILDNNFEVCDLIKDLSISYETLVGKNS